MELPKRKEIRLDGYDYSSYGAYFITICTQNRKQMLCNGVGVGIPDDPKKTVLTEIGDICDKAIAYIRERNKNIVIDKYVIMPDHIHFIVFIINEERVVKDADPYNKILPKFISSFKRFTNKKANKSIWQRGYYEHIIRNQDDYKETWKYIDENRIKRGLL